MDTELVIGQLKKALGHRIQNLVVRNPRRIYIDVALGDVVEATRAIHKDLGARFNIATGMETATDFEILYHFAFESQPPGILVSLRVHLDHEKPSVDSVTSGVPAAAWIEREMHELLGIQFNNHPDLRPLLLSDDWPKDVYPLRHGRPWEGRIEKRL